MAFANFGSSILLLFAPSFSAAAETPDRAFGHSMQATLSSLIGHHAKLMGPVVQDMLVETVGPDQFCGHYFVQKLGHRSYEQGDAVCFSLAIIGHVEFIAPNLDRIYFTK